MSLWQATVSHLTWKAPPGFLHCSRENCVKSHRSWQRICCPTLKKKTYAPTTVASWSFVLWNGQNKQYKRTVYRKHTVLFSFKTAKTREHIHIQTRFSSEHLSGTRKLIFSLQHLKWVLLLVDQIQFDRLSQLLPFLLIPFLAYHRRGKLHIRCIRISPHRLQQSCACPCNTAAGDLCFRLVFIFHAQHPFFASEHLFFLRIVYHKKLRVHRAKSYKRVLNTNSITYYMKSFSYM